MMTMRTDCRIEAPVQSPSLRYQRVSVQRCCRTLRNDEVLLVRADAESCDLRPRNGDVACHLAIRIDHHDAAGLGVLRKVEVRHEKVSSRAYRERGGPVAPGHLEEDAAVKDTRRMLRESEDAVHGSLGDKDVLLVGRQCQTARMSQRVEAQWDEELSGGADGKDRSPGILQ